MTTDRDRILSEFIDSWNAGRRPDIDEHLARAAEADRDGLLEDITGFLSWAPTPDYDDDTLAAIRAEPAMAAALAGYRRRTMSWPQVLAARRKAMDFTTEDLALHLVGWLGLSRTSTPKTRAYLEQAERGELDTSRFAQRLLDALADILRASRTELAGGAGAWQFVAAAPQFRAGDDAAASVHDDLELMADMASAPAERSWDEVDELFRGGG